MKHYIRVTSGPYKGAIYEFPTKKDALVLAKALEKGRPHSTDYGNDRDGFPEVHLPEGRQFDVPVDPDGPFSIYVRHRGESAWKNVLGPFATRKAAEKHSKDFRARGKEVAVMPAHLKDERAHATVRAKKRSHATKSRSEAMVAKMIGRHVKSSWYGLVDGEIIQWEPFGAGGTDVLVKPVAIVADVGSMRLTWYASHGLTPIDGKGPLPSRAKVRKLRETEMAESMKKIAERWAKEPPPPRIRR